MLAHVQSRHWTGTSTVTTSPNIYHFTTVLRTFTWAQLSQISVYQVFVLSTNYLDKGGDVAMTILQTLMRWRRQIKIYLHTYPVPYYDTSIPDDFRDISGCYESEIYQKYNCQIICTHIFTIGIGRWRISCEIKNAFVLSTKT